MGPGRRPHPDPGLDRQAMASNAVRHGGGDDFVLTLDLEPGRLRVGVCDCGPDQRPARWTACATPYPRAAMAWASSNCSAHVGA